MHGRETVILYAVATAKLNTLQVHDSAATT